MDYRRVSSISELVRHRFPVFTIAVALSLVASPAFASTPQGTFDRTFSVNGPVDLEVETRSGDIIVRSGPAGSVSIHGKIFVGDHWLFGNRQTDVSDIEQHPPVRQEGNGIRVDYISAHDISVDYEIIVPVDTTIRTRSGSGDQIIEGTRGNADLQSGSGDMKLAQITGEIRLQTGSGNVRAREVTGAVRGGAGSGDIEIEETGAGDVDLRTGSGNITARGIQGSFHAEAGSGDITGEGAQTGAWEIRTGSGNVHVQLPGNAAFDANLSTSSGNVEVGPAITMTVQGRVQET
ncbi:MAG: DUF4097 family beta strand repeat-containing protein, partial [Candidatus Sulfotelmatobacter sp.]